jgi:hypothetical protein
MEPNKVHCIKQHHRASKESRESTEQFYDITHGVTVFIDKFSIGELQNEVFDLTHATAGDGDFFAYDNTQ